MTLENNPDSRIQKIVTALTNRWNRLSENRKKQIWSFLTFLISCKNFYLTTRRKCLSLFNKRRAETPNAKTPVISLERNSSMKEWNNLSTPRSKKEKKINVIIPVFDRYDDLLSCIYYALKAENKTPFELFVIIHGSVPASLKHELRRLEENSLFTLIETEYNQDTLQRRNHDDFDLRDKDMILLMPDSEVFDCWIDWLYEVAYFDSNLAIVSPFSNSNKFSNYFWKTQAGNESHEKYALLNKLAHVFNARDLVDVPLEISSCLFIKKTVLHELSFNKNDFYGDNFQRANNILKLFINKGYRTAAAYPGMFVRNRILPLQSNAVPVYKTISENFFSDNYPNYQKITKRFALEDPLELYRVRLDCARLKAKLNLDDRGSNILIVSHARGGGTETFIQQLKDQEESDGQTVFVLRPNSVNNIYLEVDPLEFPNLANISTKYGIETFKEILKILAIEKIHVNSWVDYPEEFIDFLLDVVEGLKIQIAVTLHDFHLFCPKINLYRDGMLCGDSLDLNRCNICCKIDNQTPAWLRVKTSSRLLKKASVITLPSQDMRRRLLRLFPELKFKVLPHFDEPSSEMTLITNPPTFNNGVVLGCIGGIHEAKGSIVLKELAEVRGDNVLIVIGYSCNEIELKKHGVKVTGQYKNERQVYAEIKKNSINCLIIPSLMCETYSYTLSIALRTGLPVFCFDCGASAERLRSLGLKDYVLPLDYVNNPKLIWEKINIYSKSPIPYVFSGSDTNWEEYFNK